MISSWLLLAILLFSGHAYTQELIDNSNLEELISRREKAVQKQLAKKLRRPFHDISEVEWEEIAGSQTTRLYLKKNTPVVDIFTNKTYVLPRGIFVIALQKPDLESFLYLINEDWTVSYKVQSQLITPIGPELAMFAPPQEYREYSPIERQIRESFRHEIAFSFHYEQMNAVFSSDLFDDPGLSSGSGSRFSAYYFFNPDFVFSPGLTFQYETAQLNPGKGPGNSTKSASSVGVSLRSRIFESLSWNPRVLTSFSYALNSQVSYQADNRNLEENLDQTALEVALESVFPSKLGDFAVGLSFRRQWLRHIGNNRTIRLSNRAAYDDSYGLYFSWSGGWLH